MDGMKERLKDKKWVAVFAVAVCALLVALSFAALAPRYEKIETYEKFTTNLDNKRQKVVNMSALLFGTSTAIAMIPGDATTPVANEIAHMNTYLIWVLGAITLEKFLLPLIGALTFRFLVPLTIIFLLLYLLTRRLFLRNACIFLAIISIAFPSMIPASIAIGDIIDKSFGTDILLDRITEDLKKLEQKKEGEEEAGAEKEAEAEAKAEEQETSLWGQITGFAKDFVENPKENIDAIKNNVVSSSSDLVSQAKIIAGNAIEAIAALVITSCVIPIGVILIMVWLIRMSVSMIFMSLGNSMAPMMNVEWKVVGKRKRMDGDS